MKETNGAPCGFTALGTAAQRVDLPMIELLLAAGAERDAADEDGRLAYERVPQSELSGSAGESARRLLLRK
ncbi:MAG TPA: ankyrin repeat domain-containing protein [Polyangiales bacterium]|nr:ankyrin repeat domain-containing protein [Polyangiales bacterium]